MKSLPWWRSPYVTHAAQVAAAATVIIMAVYVCVCAGFDIIDRHRRVGQIDTQLQQRLDEMVSNPSAAGSLATYENTHDADDAPVFAWSIDRSGSSRTLTSGAPMLSAFRLVARAALGGGPACRSRLRAGSTARGRHLARRGTEPGRAITGYFASQG